MIDYRHPTPALQSLYVLLYMISMLAFLSIFDRRRTKVSSLAVVCPSRSVVAYINGTHIDRPQGCAQITGARTNQRGPHRSWPRAQSVTAHTSQECAQVTGARTDYHDCFCFASASALHDCSRVLYIKQLRLPALLRICCFITACITPLLASQCLCFASACFTPAALHPLVSHRLLHTCYLCSHPLLCICCYCGGS